MTPGKAQIMNEMLLDAGFMNGVTSLFVPNLCSEQDNKVSGAFPQKNVSLHGLWRNISGLYRVLYV